MTKGRILAASAALFMALAIAGTAAAQYPTPKGSLVCTTSVNIQINETQVSATIRDAAGRAIANEEVGFSIISGGGTLSNSRGLTNGSGTATVTLSGASNTSVGASYDGLECRAVAQVLGSVVRPPSTGSGGLVGGTGSSEVLLITSFAVMGMSSIVLLVLRSRRAVTVEND